MRRRTPCSRIRSSVGGTSPPFGFLPSMCSAAPAAEEMRTNPAPVAPTRKSLRSRAGPFMAGNIAVHVATDSEDPPNQPPSTTSLAELARLFLRLGATAFGGPAAHIAMMRDEVVHRRGWLTDGHFLDLLGATNLIPGPNSTEM